jgi:sec-independent protein translocase protein TatC
MAGKSEKPPAEAELPNDVPMTIWEHLRELRTRLIWCIVGTLPGMVVAWELREQLLDFLVAPLTKAWIKLGLGQPTLHFANPVDPFVAYLQIAVVCGAIFASPWIFYQAWAFIAPGLYDREKAYAIPFALASALFFAGGAFFGYAIVFPLGFESLLGMAGMLPSHLIKVAPAIMIDQYLTFATRMLLAFGVVFEVPVVVSFLALAGLVNWKQLIGFGRYWVLIAAVLAALLTPPDVGSMLMMMGPLIVLYYASVVVAYVLGPKVEREVEPSEAEE